MTEQWQELKETIIELRDNDGTATQQEVCKFLTNLMDVLEKQMQEPKTGQWILKRTFPTNLYDEYLNEYECSECYRQIRCTESQLVNFPYCHCGTKMVEPQESEVSE